MTVPIFKRNLVYTLYQNVEKNFDYYKQGTLDDLLSKPEYRSQIAESKKAAYESDNLLALRADLSSNKDVENCIIVHRELSQLTPALAADGRIWTALCHGNSAKFVWDRWVEKESTKTSQIAKIKKHFFCKEQGYRGVTRYNALSSLWWMAHVSTKNLPELPAEEAIKIFVELSDLRSNMLDRVSLTRIPSVFAAVIGCYQRKLDEDPETDFFRRTKGQQPYREWLAKINNLGGLKYYAVMTKEELLEEFWGLLKSVEQA